MWFESYKIQKSLAPVVKTRILLGTLNGDKFHESKWGAEDQLSRRTKATAPIKPLIKAVDSRGRGKIYYWDLLPPGFAAVIPFNLMSSAFDSLQKPNNLPFVAMLIYYLFHAGYEDAGIKWPK